MIKNYGQLTQNNKDRLADTWTTIAMALSDYSEVTGAFSLEDAVNDAIWAEVKKQKNDEQA